MSDWAWAGAALLTTLTFGKVTGIATGVAYGLAYGRLHRHDSAADGLTVLRDPGAAATTTRMRSPPCEHGVEIYVAGGLASVTDPHTGHVLPALAQVALEEGEMVARHLNAEPEGRTLEAFTFHDKGFVVSVGTRRGIAGTLGITTGERLAHLLKDAIEWQYRQSIWHLHGRDPVPG